MASNICFISESYVKENSPASLVTDPRVITVSILDAQDINVHQALGTKLYEKFKLIISNGDISKPGFEKYKALLDDYVVRATLYWTIFELMTFTRFKMVNKGVNEQNSDNSNPVDLESFKFARNEVKNKAEFYTERLKMRLVELGNEIPEYTTATDVDELLPGGGGYNTGMVLDDDFDFCARYLGKNDGCINL